MKLDDMVEQDEQSGRPRGILVQYQGGGYSGCHWEWNIGLFDPWGRWHSLFHSGDKGLGPDQGDLAVQRFGLQGVEHQDPTAPLVDEEIHDTGGFSRKGFVTRYLDPEALAMFLNQMNPGLALSIAKWLVSRSHYKDYIADRNIAVSLECGRCQELCPVDDLYVDPHCYHGDGGVGVVYEGLVCNDCSTEDLYDQDDQEETPESQDQPVEIMPHIRPIEQA